MGTSLLDSAYCVIDFETTGLDPAGGDRACEIALVRVRGGRIEGAFVSLLRPERSVPSAALAVHGISEERLLRAPTFRQLAQDVAAFLKGCIPVAHNALFDEAFLRTEAALAGMPLPEDLAILDTLQISRLLFPDSSRHRLCDFAGRLGIASGSHAALPDALATARALLASLPLLEARGLSSPAELAPLTTAGIRGVMQAVRNAALAGKPVLITPWWPRRTPPMRGRVQLERWPDRFLLLAPEAPPQTVYAAFTKRVEEAPA